MRCALSLRRRQPTMARHGAVRKQHGRNLLRLEFLLLLLEHDLDQRLLLGSFDHCERPAFDRLLNERVTHGSSDQSFRVENGVLWILGRLIESRLTDKPLLVSEGYIRRGRGGTLGVLDDLHLLGLLDRLALFSFQQKFLILLRVH